MTMTIGQTIDSRYRIDRLLAHGGMATVYLAHDLRLNKPVAFKVMRADIAVDPAFQQRFKLEAESAAKLQSPHIVVVTDHHQAGGLAYLVMEYVAGGSLRDLLVRYQQQSHLLPVNFALELGRQAAEGLAVAHAASLIHRDIKPDNLLLSTATAPDGSQSYILKIADFGIVRQQQPTTVRPPTKLVMGTQGYAAPEQIQNRPLDGRSDIFSLGAVLFELLSGELPPYADPVAARALLQRQRNDVGTAVETVVMACLEFDPGERFGQATHLAQALRSVINAPGQVQPRPVLPQQANGSAFTTLPASGRQFPTPLTYLPPGAALSTTRIHIRDAQGQIAYVDLQIGSVELGREVVGGIILADSLVSRHHLRIDWDGVQATVTDLASSNGSQMNGQPMSPNVAMRWPPRAALQLGGYTLYLELPQAVSAGPVSAPRPLTPTTLLSPQLAANELTIAPKRSRSSGGGEHMLMLHNSGGTPGTYSLSAEDDELALSYSFSQATIAVQPGQKEQVKLTVRSKQSSVPTERIHEFCVTARSNNGSLPLAVQGTFIHETAAVPAPVPAPATPQAATPAASDVAWFLQATSIDEMRRKNRVRPLDLLEQGALSNAPLGVYGQVTIKNLQDVSAQKQLWSHEDKIVITSFNWWARSFSYEVHVVDDLGYRAVFLVGYISKEQIATLMAFGARNWRDETSILVLPVLRKPHFRLVVALRLDSILSPRIAKVRGQLITLE